ncbi:SUZ domain-containing protein [Ditylenchus destructor]|uniref:SUZ domain-containing protein n=1 Tax=Ditylenchus destructor TaxID=166010 RepID=A0AAD4R0A0_9BILA|nr:SUZ domain-containing protein [Ditylenchus destructor]
MNLGTSDDTPASSAPKDQLAPIGSANSSILDDWENVAEELQLAQIAERQKEIVQRKQQQKVEEQQQKLPTSSPGIADTFPAQNNPMNRPIRLLKRTEISAQSKNAGDDEKAKLLTFEERQAAYLQARERIFGQTSTSEASMVDTTMQCPSATLTQSVETVLITNMPTSKKNKKKGNSTSNSGSKIENLNESKANGSPSASQESPCQQDASTESGTTTPEDSQANKEDVKNYLSDVQMVSVETAPISTRKPKTRHISQMGFGIPPPPVPIPPSYPSNLAMLVQQTMPLRYTSLPAQPQPLSKIQPGYPYKVRTSQMQSSYQANPMDQYHSATYGSQLNAQPMFSMPNQAAPSGHTPIVHHHPGMSASGIPHSQHLYSHPPPGYGQAQSNMTGQPNHQQLQFNVQPPIGSRPRVNQYPTAVTSGAAGSMIGQQSSQMPMSHSYYGPQTDGLSAPIGNRSHINYQQQPQLKPMTDKPQFPEGN